MSMNNEIFQAVPLDDFLANKQTNTFTAELNDAKNEFMN